MVTELRQEEDLDRFLQQSQKDPVVIFKHSTQCGISAGALDELNAFMAEHSDVPCGMLLVLEQRSLSDLVEDRFGIRHASPQAIVFVEGSPVWNASHGRVTAQALEDAIATSKQSS